MPEIERNWTWEERSIVKLGAFTQATADALHCLTTVLEQVKKLRLSADEVRAFLDGYGFKLEAWHVEQVDGKLDELTYKLNDTVKELDESIRTHLPDLKTL